MEEIILSTPSGEAFEETSQDVQPSSDYALPVSELRQRLHRQIFQIRKARDRFALTASGRQRRREDFQAAMKSLAKGTAAEIVRPMADRRDRMEARTRIYAAMMVLAEAATRDREAVEHDSRAAVRNGIILTAAAMLALGTLAVSRGWIVLPA